ncbi:hypothetical protein OOZ15_16195 [Galbibacter sp. EGI 63066]|uniref:hypothetical protein n=1 Tax=Galbibacter sp. EGI 63066 TaxID=2993559 RepID=UPI0022498AAC|nr:hypothetical protein [Galbibacter sp. EGI 63066]MCX2681495.1 hypothetical protein [Galbibacter sp. EGI 63066]
MADFDFYFKRSIFLFELTAFIIGLICYGTYKTTPNKIIIYFLVITLLNEIIGLIPIIVWKFPESSIAGFLEAHLPDILVRNNIWIASIHSILSFYIFLIYFRELSKRENSRLRMFNWLLVIYTVSVVYDLIHYKTLYIKLGDTHRIVGALCSLIAALLYMKIMLKSDRIIMFYKQLSFWIMVGIIFFNLVTMPIFIFADQLGFSGPVYNYVLVFSCYIMYGCFIVGFIVHARQWHPPPVQ